MEAHLVTNTPIRLQLDQSKYLGLVGKPSDHNSSSVYSNNIERNSFSWVSSYMQSPVNT